MRIPTRAARASVYNSYGATEVGAISHKCLQHQMHVNHHSVLVEVTRDGELVAPSEEGEITVTNLYNYAQPAIRYNLENIGYLDHSACSCTNNAPILILTQGRKIDVIQRRNRHPIAVNEICVPLHVLDGIKQFQILQESLDSLTINIVPGRAFTTTQYTAAQRLVQQCIGDEMHLNLQLVDHNPREQSGKLTRFKTRLQ